MADDWDDLTTAKAGGQYLAHAIRITEAGDELPVFESAWSDTAPDGSVASPGLDYCCYDWTIGGFTAGQTGMTNETNGYWTDIFSIACTASQHLYCFQQG